MPEIINYFPEYEDTINYIPPKQFMWDIFCTNNQEMANKLVNHSLSQRSKQEGNEDKTIEVTEDVLNQLHGANYFSKKKGKALFMLKAGKTYGVVQRKRKKKYESLNLKELEEEKKEFQSKRAKISDGNSKITEWLQMKKQSTDFINKKSECSNDDESQENDMNIDADKHKINNPFIKR